MRLPAEIFAHRLREERQRAGVNQAELAEAVGDALGQPVAASAISRIESGERAPKLDEAVVMAARIGVPLASLLRDRDAADDRIGELKRSLAEQIWQADRAREDLERRRSSIARLEREIERLEDEREEQ